MRPCTSSRRRGWAEAPACGEGGNIRPRAHFTDLLRLYRDDPQAEAVCLIGEMGGDAEERAAAYIRSSAYPKPVFGFIAGLSARRQAHGPRGGHHQRFFGPGGGANRRLGGGGCYGHPGTRLAWPPHRRKLA
ncbi:MAG: hypothetical protein V8Q84_13085 [Bilophila sp.]